MCEFYEKQLAAHLAAGKDLNDFVCPREGCTRFPKRLLGFVYQLGACLQEQEAKVASQAEKKS